MEDMVVLHFGTGIGGGIIQDGCLLNGSSYSAGEFGHIVVCFDDGPDCMCGNSGCVEAYAGGWALNKLAKEMEVIGCLLLRKQVSCNRELDFSRKKNFSLHLRPA